MLHHPRRLRLHAAIGCVLIALTSACGADDDSTADPANLTSTSAEASTTSIDERWRDDAVALCEATSAGFGAIAPPASPDDVTGYVEAFAALDDELEPLRDIDLPVELTEPPTDLAAVFARSAETMDRARDQLAQGNVNGPEFSDSAEGSMDVYRSTLAEAATVLAIAGVPCGPAEPQRLAQADLNVPVSTAWQVATGFGSVWVSQRFGDSVWRVEPDTGEVLAVVDVGSQPVKLQPADDLMLVRTADAYVSIDPETDAVADTLAKVDVGPAADRAWAVDGALWICDGDRLHRYDPERLDLVTTIELGVACGQVHATDELVVAWTFDEDAAQSGSSAAVFVDPETDEVLGRVDLPMDVNVPVVVDDAVYFPPNPGSEPVVVDRSTWTVSAAPALADGPTGSESAYDGSSIYVISEKRDVAVIDPTTFEVTETIEAFDFAPPFGNQVNSVAVGPGALWVVNDEASILQRFDRPS